MRGRERQNWLTSGMNSEQVFHPDVWLQPAEKPERLAEWWRLCGYYRVMQLAGLPTGEDSLLRAVHQMLGERRKIRLFPDPFPLLNTQRLASNPSEDQKVPSESL